MRRFLLGFLPAAVALCATLTAAPAARAQNAVRITFSEYACSEPSQPCEYQATTGRAVTSQGFDFLDRGSIFGSGTNSLGTWSNAPSNLGSRNRPSNLGTSTALFAPNNGDFVEMYTASGRNFSLYQMDVASLFRQSSITPPLGAPAAFNLYFQYFLSFDSFYNDTPDGDFYATVPPAALVGGDRVPLLRTIDFTGGLPGAIPLQFLGGSQSDLRSIFGIQWVQGSLSGFDASGAPTFTATSGRAHQFTNIVAQVVPEPGTFGLAAGGLLVVAGAARRRRRDA